MYVAIRVAEMQRMALHQLSVISIANPAGARTLVDWVPVAKQLSHRAEIDGLRAVAVLPVILFHAGFKSFGGGFIGVDDFFVISGFLITSIITHDLLNERFSYARFYARLWPFLDQGKAVERDARQRDAAIDLCPWMWRCAGLNPA